MEINELLEISTDTFLGLKELNRIVPEIKEKAIGVQENLRKSENDIVRIEKAVEEARRLDESIDVKMKHIENMTSEAVRKVENLTNELTQMMKKLEKKNASVNIPKDLLERLDELENRMEEHQESIDELGESVSDLDERLETVEEQIDEYEESDDDDSDDEPSPSDDTETEDSEEYYTISELYAKNRKKHLIVVRDNWSNDYCFLVQKIDKGYAQGIAFLNGERRRETSYPANREEYREYDGPSRSKIYSRV